MGLKAKTNFLTTLVLGLALLAPLSCGQNYSSSYYDADIYGEGGGGTPEFQAAQAILRTECATCHAQTSHQSWGNISEAQFISLGLVSPGNLSGSLLYTKLKNNSVNGTGNMPPSYSLSTTQIQTIETWILGIP